MVKHIVMWRFRDSAEGGDKTANMAKAKAMLEGMRGKVPGLAKLEVGVDFCRTAAAWDMALYSEFESRAALTGYQDHPMHVAVKEFIGPVVSERAIVDYEA
jgi:hypothetical protein